MRHAALAVSVLGLVCLAACGKKAPAPERAAQIALSASSRTAGSAPSASAALAGHPSAGCRALAVTGKARADGVPIAVGTLLDGEHWVELEPGASVALRHALTSRELTLYGPGSILPCRHGSEQFLLGAGRITTTTKLGVRPGAEVLIATEGAIVHYGDAGIDVEQGPSGLRLRVREGEVWFEPRDPGATPSRNPLHSPASSTLPPNQTPVAELVAACERAAQTAAESARRVLAGPEASPNGSLGERTAAQMRDRTAARWACSMAAAAAGSVTDPAARQRLWASIAHSDGLWQAVPRAISAQKN
jgi:hypothetical protein